MDKFRNLWESDLNDVNDVERYSRQIILPNIKTEGQNALDNARVLIVGLGGLGSPVLMYLATTGIKNIGIVDYDKVELHNLQRQVIHSESTIGEFKTTSAKRFISQLNSTVNITEYNVYLNEDSIIDTIKEYDIIADCCDSIKLRYLINDACRILNKDLVSASVLKWEGQIYIARKGGSCYRCMFPDMKETAPNCATSGVLGPMCGVIGGLQATEIVKLILPSNKNENIGSFIIYNGFSNIFKIFHKNFPECTACKTKQMGKSISKPCELPSLANDRIMPWSKIISNINNYLLVDIRKNDHFKMFRVKESLNIPDFEKDIEKIREFHKPVIVTCYKGKSSLKAADYLNKHGIEAYSSEGGIEGFRSTINNKY